MSQLKNKTIKIYDRETFNTLHEKLHELTGLENDFYMACYHPSIGACGSCGAQETPEQSFMNERNDETIDGNGNIVSPGGICKYQYEAYIPLKTLSHDTLEEFKTLLNQVVPDIYELIDNT